MDEKDKQIAELTKALADMTECKEDLAIVLLRQNKLIEDIVHKFEEYVTLHP